MCSFTKHLTFKWPLERALWTLSLYAEVHSEAKGKVLKHHLATPPPQGIEKPTSFKYSFTCVFLFIYTEIQFFSTFSLRTVWDYICLQHYKVFLIFKRSIFYRQW